MMARGELVAPLLAALLLPMFGFLSAELPIEPLSQYINADKHR